MYIAPFPPQNCFSLALAAASALLPLQANGQIQTSREYQLEFNYDPRSSVGPSMWSSVDPSNVGDWSDFTVFMNTANHDLKINKNFCDDPRRPSPVNLHPTTQCDDNHEILTKMISKHDCSFSDMTFEIAPNLLRAFMPYDNMTCRLPAMNLSGDLPNDWTFMWLEVHARSEHVIDGRRFDGELQLIHLGNNAQNRELAIPTILLDASSPFDEPRLQRFLDKWQEVHDTARQSCAVTQGLQNSAYQYNGTDVSKRHLREKKQQPNVGSSFMALLERYRSSLGNFVTTVGSILSDSEYSTEKHLGQSSSNQYQPTSRSLQGSVNATSSLYGQPYGPRRKMFPYDLFPTIYHYKYLGSITYPPCSQIVRYDVFDEPLKISRRQLRQLGALQGSYINEETCATESVVSPTGENFRPLQVLNETVQNSSHCQLDRYRLWKYPTAYQ